MPPIPRKDEPETLKKTMQDQSPIQLLQCNLVQCERDKFSPQMKNRSPLTRLFRFQRMIKLYYVISLKRARLSAAASPPSKIPACIFFSFYGLH